MSKALHRATLRRTARESTNRMSLASALRGLGARPTPAEVTRIQLDHLGPEQDELPPLPGLGTDPDTIHNTAPIDAHRTPREVTA